MYVCRKTAPDMRTRAGTASRQLYCTLGPGASGGCDAQRRTRERTCRASRARGAAQPRHRPSPTLPPCPHSPASTQGGPRHAWSLRAPVAAHPLLFCARSQGFTVVAPVPPSRDAGGQGTLPARWPSQLLRNGGKRGLCSSNVVNAWRERACRRQRSRAESVASAPRQASAAWDSRHCEATAIVFCLLAHPTWMIHMPLVCVGSSWSRATSHTWQVKVRPVHGRPHSIGRDQRPEAGGRRAGDDVHRAGVSASVDARPHAHAGPCPTKPACAVPTLRMLNMQSRCGCSLPTSSPDPGWDGLPALYAGGHTPSQPHSLHAQAIRPAT